MPPVWASCKTSKRHATSCITPASGHHGPVRVTASDVLYYLSAADNRTLAVQLRSILPLPGTLLIANEWNQNYHDLTHPKIAVECFTGPGLWTCRSLEEHPTGQGQMHVVAVLA